MYGSIVACTWGYRIKSVAYIKLFDVLPRLLDNNMLDG
jgi:hypothetical protein